MAHQDLDFGQRVDRLTRRHRAMSRGYATVLRDDGLLVTAPARRGTGLSLRVIVVCILWLCFFKALLFATVGGATYEDRVSRLAEGNMAEAAGAWVMQADPVTRALGAQIAKLMP